MISFSRPKRERKIPAHLTSGDFVTTMSTATVIGGQKDGANDKTTESSTEAEEDDKSEAKVEEAKGDEEEDFDDEQ